MKNKIKGLILLQNCDNQIKKVEAKKKEGPLKIKDLEERFNEAHKVFQEKYEKLESVKKDKREIDSRIQEIENKVQRSQEKLNNIKTNKEYAAALKEIEGLGNEKNTEEDKSLQLMEEIESLEGECSKSSDEQKALKDQFEKDKKKIEKEALSLDKELADLEEKRKKYADNVDQDLLKKYDFIKSRKDGVAIGPVVQGVCQTCHMGIPPQKFNELKKCTELMSCPNCNRLIYWGEDEFFIRELG